MEAYSRDDFLAAASPLLDALNHAGLPSEGFGQFVSKRGAEVLGTTPPFDYKRSVRLLIEWLPRIEDRRVKEAIVRSLSTKYARPVAAPVLIDEFRKAGRELTTFAWAVGNALEVVADRSVFDDLVDLATDSGYGKAREMVVLALARTKHPGAPGVLIGLLSDQEVAGHAVVALGKLAPAEARGSLLPFTTDKRAWVRRAALNAIAKIDKRAASE